MFLILHTHLQLFPAEYLSSPGGHCLSSQHHGLRGLFFKMLIPSHLFVEIPERLMTDAAISSPFHLKCQGGSRHILLPSELSLMNAGQHPPRDVPKIIFLLPINMTGALLS